MGQEDKIRLKVREHWIMLAGGLFVIGFSLFILVMGLRYPSAGGNRAVFAMVLALMTGCGVFICAAYFCRCLTVEEMDIYYVNYMGRRRTFSLDDIGYCKFRLYGSRKEAMIESFVMFDLLGKRLCKLEMNMTGIREFLQYLLDNQVKMQWPGAEKGETYIREPALLETAICKEEISKYTEAFYDMMSPVFTEWERRYQKFEAHWEFGLTEYAQKDITDGTDMWEWESTIGKSGEEELPEDYVCVGEAYLKRGEEYVMNRKGYVVGFPIPYIRQTKSYQIGERRRIRKMDEQQLKDWISIHLEQLAKELPRHSYHTQALILGHVLTKKVRDIPFAQNVLE